MANIIGGIICPNNHLSIKAIEYQGVIILEIVFLKVIDLKVSKGVYLICTVFYSIIKYQ